MFADVGLLALRLALGAVFLAHGAQKGFGAFGGPGFEGATATAMRPHGFEGKPCALFSSSCVHDAPPSVLLKKPLPLTASGPSPPDRKVQPLRRKSHMPA